MKRAPGLRCLAIVLSVYVSQPATAEETEIQVIFLMHDGIELQTMKRYAGEYKQWETPKVHILFRIQNTPKLLEETVCFCEANTRVLTYRRRTRLSCSIWDRTKDAVYIRWRGRKRA